MNYWTQTEEVIIDRIIELKGEPQIEFEYNEDGTVASRKFNRRDNINLIKELESRAKDAVEEIKEQEEEAHQDRLAELEKEYYMITIHDSADETSPSAFVGINDDTQLYLPKNVEIKVHKSILQHLDMCTQVREERSILPDGTWGIRRRVIQRFPYTRHSQCGID